MNMNDTRGGTPRGRVSFGFFFGILCVVLGVPSLRAQSLRFPFLRLEGEAFTSFASDRYEVIPQGIASRDQEMQQHFTSVIPSGSQSAQISLVASGGKRSGFYTPYEGRDTYSARLEGMGHVDLGAWGRLFGRIHYARGGESDLGYSSIRNADFYLPYIVADSSGGDYHHEQYLASGLYSYKKDSLEWGASLSYAGEMAYRYTDPRAANTSNTLQPGVSLSLFSKYGKSSLSLHYLYHRQYLHLWLWRPEQQDKFFLTYGFGMVDVKHTPIFFGTSRMNYVNGWRCDLAHQKGGGEDHSEYLLSASYLGYFFRAEEPSAVGLFGHLNHRGQLHLSYRYKKWRWMAELEATQRNGREYIYAEERPENMHASVYDRVVIDVHKAYILREWNAHLRSSYRFSLGKGAAELDLGGQFYQRNEQHKTLDCETGYALIRPYVGGQIQPSPVFSVGVTYAYRIPLFPTRYRVASGYKDQLDYQLAYLPLLDASREAHEWRMRVATQFRIGAHRIQVAWDGFYARERKNGNLPVFDHEPTTRSHLLSSPQTFPTAGHSFWTRLGIAYIF